MNVYITNNQDFKHFEYFFPGLKQVTNLRYFEQEIEEGKIDLIIFPGGEDVNPRRYGEENLYSQINDERDMWEKNIFNTVFRKVPILGICRGHQFLNVMMEGSLYQDYKFQLNVPYHPYRHPLEFKVHQKDFKNPISDIIRDNLVTSTHHQSVKNIGLGGLILAVHNNIIESVYYKNEGIYTFQFHPEYLREDWVNTFFDFIKEWAEKYKKENKVEGKAKRKVIKLGLKNNFYNVEDFQKILMGEL